jgi:hypothetical protein
VLVVLMFVVFVVLVFVVSVVLAPSDLAGDTRAVDDLWRCWS